MPLRWQTLKPDVFLIEADGSQPILYAPLQGVAMEVNEAYVRRFRAALDGHSDSALSLGLSPEILNSFVEPPASLAWRLDPKWPGAFEPTSLTVFLTHRCTMRCSYCYCHGGEGRDMPWLIFKRAVDFTADNARRLGRRMNLSFHGGDMGACWPLFLDGVSFAEQVCAASGIGLDMTIGTNGLYTDEQARTIADHVQSATLSIDGLPAIHNRCRKTVDGRDTLDRVLHTARVFDERGLSYSARMTVTDEDVGSLAESVDFICRSIGVKSIRAEPLYSRGRAVTNQLRSPDAEAFVAAFLSARKVAQSHGRDLSYSAARVKGVYCSFCSYPDPTFGVTPEGNLTCCYEVLHPDDPLRKIFFFGKMREDGTGIDVDQDRVAAIRERARSQRAACRGCFCVNACAGDCTAKVMENGPAEGEVPRRCQITRALVYDAIRTSFAP